MSIIHSKRRHKKILNIYNKIIIPPLGRHETPKSNIE